MSILRRYARFAYVFVALVPSFAFAQNTTGLDAGKCPKGALCNPLHATSISELIANIIDVILVFATPLIVLMIMYAGFLFVTARGNEGQVESAKKALLWSVVGGVIVLGARIISTVIEGTITSF
ncbi:MAG TPA: pilin [Candidatus Paceibacterota bacterium]|nr:pilin [Candidatus Paceibacterota bacterium]